MRFSALSLLALAGLAIAADSSANPGASVTSVGHSILSSISASILSESTKSAAKATTTTHLTATPSGAAVAIGAGEPGGIIVAVLGVVAWML